MSDAGTPVPTGSRPPDGFFFEDFAVGQRFGHATPRTITAGDCALYIGLTGARQPVHCAEPVARALGHPSCPVDDLLVFHLGFGKTVNDISYNAIANLGYAGLRFHEPVYVGDTLKSQTQVIGLKQNSNGKGGVVYVASRALNQHGRVVLDLARWVMVSKRNAAAPAPATVVPELPREVAVADLAVPKFLKPGALDLVATGGARLWDDYKAGETIDHPGGMTLEESDHMMATRLYQITSHIHFDAFRALSNQFGKRLIYGGHVISTGRALSHDGLENAFQIAAINGGTHANPTFAGDTLYCRHVVLDRMALPGRDDIGALRLRMLVAKNVTLAQLPAIAPGEKNGSVVLDLDYTVLIPRRQKP
ncbi:MaoC family dehydratase [Usitatibacter palustris]|uniref:Beta-methylmalyl-CoA dehydratase n=1 Tax=Usitatibacter palustris TaxID=2732487 RepID=A0A6M4H5E9_9PROT|nr:MaoC family dehydratase [Usitatibacter palustris]QJR14889.1 Beta-methylmalyl-CoA dehydratase [Usitatibacter palustris]